MAVDFYFDLDEIVRFGNSDISLRRALREYIETKKRITGGVIAPPMWLRDQGKKPGSFDAGHMDALAASIRTLSRRRTAPVRRRRRRPPRRRSPAAIPRGR
jgi:hypothetical protein